MGRCEGVGRCEGAGSGRCEEVGSGRCEGVGNGRREGLTIHLDQQLVESVLLLMMTIYTSPVGVKGYLQHGSTL